MRTLFLSMTLMVGLIGPIADPSATFAEESTNTQVPVSYTHLTLPTTPYV